MLSRRTLMGPTSIPRSWNRPRRKYRWCSDIERRTGLVIRMLGRCWFCWRCSGRGCALDATAAPAWAVAPALPRSFGARCRRCRADRLYARSAFASCLSCDRINAARLCMYASPSHVSLVVAMARRIAEAH